MRQSLVAERVKLSSDRVYGRVDRLANLRHCHLAMESEKDRVKIVAHRRILLHTNTSSRHQILGEDFVEERAGAPLAEARDSVAALPA